MPRQAIQTNDYDFNVTQTPLYTVRDEDNKKSGYLANVREDTGEVLGICTDRYALVQNSDLIDRAEAAFERKGLTDFEREVYVTDSGSKMRVNYDFKGHDIEIPEVGDTMGFRLTLQNSFDRSLRVSFALGMLRLVCTNGMQTLEKEFDMLKKHSAQLDLDKLLTTEAIDSALNRFKESGDVFGRLAMAKITQDEGKAALGNLLKKNVFSEKVREGIANRFDNPTYEEDGKAGNERNLYQLYNAVTQHLTADNLTDSTGNAVGRMVDTRFEYANRISSNVLKSLDRATTNKNNLAALVAMPKLDEQLIAQN
jgi:hypothetical protein